MLQASFAGTNVVGSRAFSSPLRYPFFTSESSGASTFIPESDSVTVDVDITGAVVGGAWVTLDFYYALATVTGQMTPATQAAALAAGVTQVRVGPLPASVMGASGRHAKFKLTGLTPGVAYRWELAVAIVGIAANEATGTTPTKVGCSSSSDADGFYRAVVRNDGSNNCTLFKVAGLGVVDVDPLKVWTTLALPAVATSGSVAVTPDGSKAAVTNNANNSVSLVTLPANGTTTPTLATFTVPGATPNPLAVAITPDGATAWVSQSALNQVVPMRISDGSFGTAVALGSSHTIAALEIAPDGTKLVAACQDGYVAVFSISGSAGWPTSPTATLDGGTATGFNVVHADAIGITPDSATAYIASGAQNGFFPFTIATRVAGSVVSVGVAATSLEVLPDGLSLLVIANTATAGEQVHHFSLIPGLGMPEYVKWQVSTAAGAATQPGGIALSGRGDILITAKTPALLYDWCGAELRLRPSGDSGGGGNFYGELARVLVTPAH